MGLWDELVAGGKSLIGIDDHNDDKNLVALNRRIGKVVDSIPAPLRIVPFITSPVQSTVGMLAINRIGNQGTRAWNREKQAFAGTDNKKYANAEEQKQALLEEARQRNNKALAAQAQQEAVDRWNRLNAMGEPLTRDELNTIYKRYMVGPSAGLTSAFNAGNANMRNELDAALTGIGMAYDRGRSLTDQSITANRAAMEEAAKRIAAINNASMTDVAAMQSNMTGATDGGAAMALAPVTGAVTDAGAAVSANGSIASELNQSLGNVTNDDLQYMRGLMDVQQGAQAGAAQRLQAANMANFASQYAQLVAQEEAQQRAAAMQEISGQEAERRAWRMKLADQEMSQPQINPLGSRSQLAFIGQTLTSASPNDTLSFAFVPNKDGTVTPNPMFGTENMPDPVGMGSALNSLARYIDPDDNKAMEQAAAYWSTFVGNNPVAQEIMRRSGISNPADLVRLARSTQARQ